MFAKLWKDEAGVISVEYLFLVTIVGLGLVVGFANLEGAINVEYTELSTVPTIRSKLSEVRMSRIGPLVPAARDGTPLSAPRPPATPCSGSACSVEQLLLSGQDPWELESADTPTSTLPPGIQQTCWRHRWEPARITLRWHTAEGREVVR